MIEHPIMMIPPFAAHRTIRVRVIEDIPGYMYGSSMDVFIPKGIIGTLLKLNIFDRATVRFRKKDIPWSLIHILHVNQWNLEVIL